MQKLIIINGTMGIGKTTIARLVFTQLPNSAYLCGDAVWQINPFEVNDKTRALVEQNLAFVLRSYLVAGYEYVMLDWVMHQQSIIDAILAPLNDRSFELQVFTLVADEEVAVERCLARDGGQRNPEGVLSRLRQSRELDSIKIDTSRITPEEAAGQILAAIIGPI
jgi:predicted ABC-type ATPase